MEVSQSDAATSGTQEVDQKLQMSSKPVHRFIKGEPKSLGVTLDLWTWVEKDVGKQAKPRVKYNEGL